MNTAHKTLTIYEKMFCMKTRNAYQLLSSQDIVICNKIRSYIANNDTIQYLYNRLFLSIDQNEDFYEEIDDDIFGENPNIIYWYIDIESNDNIESYIHNTIDKCSMLDIGNDLLIENLKLIVYLDVIELFKILIRTHKNETLNQLENIILYTSRCIDSSNINKNCMLSYLELQYTKIQLYENLHIEFNEWILTHNDQITHSSINFLLDIGFKSNINTIQAYITIHNNYDNCEENGFEINSKYNDILHVISKLLNSIK
jgi:hypothetical protein